MPIILISNKRLLKYKNSTNIFKSNFKKIMESSRLVIIIYYHLIKLKEFYNILARHRNLKGYKGYN